MYGQIPGLKAAKYHRILILFWIVSYLGGIDIAINYFAQFPEDPQTNPPSFLQSYFEYGRSVEGKLDRMTKHEEGKSAGILGYGWLEDRGYERLPKKAGGNQTLVAVYGMSHAKLLAEALTKVDNTYVIREITAPGAPANWSFAAYEKDRGHHEAKVVILGIMTDNVPYLSSTAGTTSYFDMSHPYTFPRCSFEGGQLKQTWPPFFTGEEFREYFFSAKKWGEYRDWLKKNDKFYDAFLFRRSVTDVSALLRVLRRAYSETVKQKKIGDVYTREGFVLNSEEVVTLRAVVREFGRSVREKNGLAIVYIVNNEGRSDHLYKALKPILDADRIAYLSTHIICPPDDPRVYNGVNSHFTPAKDEELAREMIKIIKGEILKLKGEVVSEKRGMQ
jgi:hypothetical protein